MQPVGSLAHARTLPHGQHSSEVSKLELDAAAWQGSSESPGSRWPPSRRGCYNIFVCSVLSSEEKKGPTYTNWTVGLLFFPLVRWINVALAGVQTRLGPFSCDLRFECCLFVSAYSVFPLQVEKKKMSRETEWVENDLKLSGPKIYFCNGWTAAHPGPLDAGHVCCAALCCARPVCLDKKPSLPKPFSSGSCKCIRCQWTQAPCLMNEVSSESKVKVSAWQVAVEAYLLGFSSPVLPQCFPCLLSRPNFPLKCFLPASALADTHDAPLWPPQPRCLCVRFFIWWMQVRAG